MWAQISFNNAFFSAYYWSDDPDVKNARDAYKDHEYYDDCVKFCEQYDQVSFDPDYDSLPLDFFEPMVAKIVHRSPYSTPAHEKDNINSSKKLLAGGYPQSWLSMFSPLSHTLLSMEMRLAICESMKCVKDQPDDQPAQLAAIII